MKTKTSKRVLSFILAVMMVVTSIPMMAFTAFGDEAVAVDPAVKEVQDAMDAFEAKLATSGAFTNVDVAYNAYVDCQKALDAYIYGGETGALSGKAAALTTATNNVTTFTGYKGTAVPSFEGDTTFAMTDYAEGNSQANTHGAAYNNILYTTQTTSSNEMSSETGNVIHRIIYPETTLLYDGTNDTLMPVMGMASVNAKKKRYIYASYPCVSATDNNDNASFNLRGYWHSAEGGTLDFTWSYDQTANTPGYNYATGYKGNQSTDHRSTQLTYTTGAFGSFKSGNTRYIANVMKFVGTPASTYSDYTLTWYVSSGDTANSDVATIDASASKIHVVNYKTLLEGLKTNGNKMKLVDLNDFSEGGLSDYINAMEAATDFNPNTYFTSSNNYQGCAQQIATLVSNMNNASVTNTNSADYAALRSAMAENVRAVFAGGNTGYTDESWNTFYQKYVSAQTIMANCNDVGYTSTSAATAASELVTAYNNLQTNVVKADTTALEAAIDKFEAYQNIFTADSYNAVKATVESAKVAVWGTADDYKVPTAAPDDSTEAQTLIANQAQAVLDAIRTLVISTETVISTDEGDKYTMVSALALADRISDPTDYSNYATFSGAVTDANNYVATLATTPFTDYDAQLAEYRTQVLKVVNAFFALKYSFVKLPDGTVTGATTSAITTLEDHKNNNGYNWWIDFSYPGSAIVFKTTHDALTVPYGNANVTFKINIDNNISKENNALDSITINGTADANTQITSNDATSIPPGLSADQLSTYTGCLANNGFSLKNFRVTGQMNNRKTYFGTDASGNAVTGKESATDAYTKILATTEGTEKNPAWGTIALQPGAKGDSSITLTADMSLDIPATTKKTLTGSTVPTKTNYSHLGYFGATYVWNTQPTLAYAGYAYLTSKSNSEQISSTVSVVDMSYLVDLVAQCNALVPEAEKYTAQTWAALQSALEAAQADLDYKGMTADAILTEVKNRYSNLWAKYSALEVKTFSVVFNWKNSAGKDTSKNLTVSYGDTLSMSKYVTQINAITTPDYVADNYTYSFKEWSPAVDLDAPVKADATYVAQYTGTPNNASWDAYDVAKTALQTVLTDKTYSSADLIALNTELEGLTYYSYTEEQRATVFADSQTAIDSETAKLTELKNGLTPAGLDTSAAEAAMNSKDDADRYTRVFELYTTVSVAGTEIIAFAYATQEELDAALNASMIVKSYTIYLNGSAVVTADYGTPVIVNSDGTYELNVLDTHPDYSGSKAAWYYSYSAPSTNDTQTASKFMTSAASFGFIVKGNTFLTTENLEQATGYAVTFVANLGGNSKKTYSVCYTDADGNIQNMPSAPSYAYYTFSNYTINGVEYTEGTAVTGDCTIVANYTVASIPTYNISFYDSYQNWSDGASLTNSYKYNELVSLNDTNGDADYWFAGILTVDSGGNVNGEELHLIACGPSYSFYACQSFDENNWDQGVYSGIISLSETELQELLAATAQSRNDGTEPFTLVYDGQGNEIKAEGNSILGYTYPSINPTVTALDEPIPVYESGSLAKMSLIGTFVIPTGYTMVETGFLVTSTNGADMTVENSGTDVVRMKSSKYTCGNQFVINIKAPADGSTRTFDYVAYAIVKDSKGEQQVIYSAKNSGTTANF